MAELYRQVVLKEAKPELATGLQIQGLGKKKTDHGQKPSRTSRQTPARRSARVRPERGRRPRANR